MQETLARAGAAWDAAAPTDRGGAGCDSGLLRGRPTPGGYAADPAPAVPRPALHDSPCWAGGVATKCPMENIQPEGIAQDGKKLL